MQKPLSIRAMQGLLILVLCLYIPLLALYLVREAANWRLIYDHGLVLYSCGMIVVRLAIVFVFLAALRAIVRHTRHARLLGLAALAILFATWCFAVAHQGTGHEPFPLQNEAQRGGALIGRGLIAVLFIALFYRFGFGKPARRYFSEQ